MFMRLYKQYLGPQLEFASPAWNPWQQGDKDVLERVQEKAVKMVSGLRATT
jgi:ribonuclease P/MRP protein subunit RPP40